MNQNPYESPSNSGGAPPRSPGSEFANCPSCGSGDASKVGWTFWGGVVGPKLLHHVKCNQCKTKYNGKSGESNLVPIIIYSVVSFVIAVAIFVAIRMII